jgi:ketosteroid isomerase-like protein
LNSAERQTNAVNDAVATRDMESIRAALHADIVWEHNLGSGSLEEGVYEGRDSVVRLFERLVEPWEYIRPQPRSYETRGDVLLVRGELHSKHREAEAVVVTPYEQRIEVRDGLLYRCRMAIGGNRLVAEGAARVH